MGGGVMVGALGGAAAGQAVKPDDADQRFDAYPDFSLKEWHRKHGPKAPSD